MINLKSRKTGIFGIQGSGKTYIAENQLIKAFKHPVVYLMHPEDFKVCKNNVKVYIPKDKAGRIDTSVEHLDYFIGLCFEDMKAGKIDAVFIDEADLFFPKDFRTLQRYKNIHDFVINHRHYGKKKGEGCALIYISRRPQDITTNIVETTEHIFLFSIEGKNVKDYMVQLNTDYKDLIPRLNKDNHNFIYKHLGEAPKLMAGIKPTTKLKQTEK